MGELDGRVAIVTGSTRGTRSGDRRAIRRARAPRWWSTAATPMRCAWSPRIPGCDRARRRHRRSPASADELVAAAVAEFGRVDIAREQRRRGDRQLHHRRHRRTMGGDAGHEPVGPVRRAAGRDAGDEGLGGGAVLNVISWAGERGNVGQVAYSASKAGLHAVTLSAAKELGKFGIRVNSLSPAVPTDMTVVMDETAAEGGRLAQAAQDHGHAGGRRRGRAVPVLRPQPASSPATRCMSTAACTSTDRSVPRAAVRISTWIRTPRSSPAGSMSLYHASGPASRRCNSPSPVPTGGATWFSWGDFGRSPTNCPVRVLDRPTVPDDGGIAIVMRQRPVIVATELARSPPAARRCS